MTTSSTMASAPTALTVRPVTAHPSRTFDDANGLVNVYGNCQSFCTSELKASGETIEDHGDRCVGPSHMIYGTSEDGSRFRISAELVAPYHHGRYLEAHRPLAFDDERTIQLALEGSGITADATAIDDEKLVQIKVGDALRLARFLEHLVGVADMTIGTEPENCSASRRRAER